MALALRARSKGLCYPSLTLGLCGVCGCEAKIRDRTMVEAGERLVWMSDRLGHSLYLPHVLHVFSLSTIFFSSVACVSIRIP